MKEEVSKSRNIKEKGLNAKAASSFGKQMLKPSAILQIFIMIVSIVAFAWLISPELVSGQKDVVCCERTKSGAWCQNVPSTECQAGFQQSPTSCEATSFCRQGCCYDSSEGICMENTPQRVCEENKGVWRDSASCDIPQCQLGCCVLGTQAAFTTLTRCKQLSAFYNLETDYRKNIPSELECISLASLSDEGACVYEVDYVRTCKFTTRQECKNIAEGSSLKNGSVTSNATFYKDYLCSAEELATNCGLTQQTKCVDGKDEVYFVDSCGNPANIYDSQRINDKAYWSKVVKKEDSCGFGNTNGNANSKTCGNCDYFYSSMCKKVGRGETRPTYGENICKNLDCKLENGEVKKNGESWCYTDKPGGKTDTVGSRHFRYVCINGEVILEPCADFRQEVCIESKIGAGAERFSQANCIVNRWQDCILQTEKVDCLNTDKRDCKWISKLEKVEANETACVPLNAPGLEFWNDEAAKQVCNTGSSVCVYKEKLTAFTGFDWKPTGYHPCVDDNGNLNQNWVKEQNEKCNAVGDCGTKINYIGKTGYKTGYNVSMTKLLLLPLLKTTKALGLIVFGKGGFVSGENSGGKGGAPQPQTWAQTIGKALGAAATAYGVVQMIGAMVAPEEKGAVNALSWGAAAGFLVSKILGKFWTNQKAVTWTSTGIGLLIAFLTYEDERTKAVTFECNPYQPPLGGNDCEKCNSEKYPCTEYRCKSLGQACQIINKGTKEEKCAWINPRDINSPIIMPNENVLTIGYKYVLGSAGGIRPPATGFRITREDGSCVKAFTPITFGISTNEPTTCKLDYNHTTSFENMSYWLGGSNTLKYNHTQLMSLPGPSNINNQNPIIQNEGEYNLFIRCQDANGNSNAEEYVVKFCVEKGPDVTPPKIMGTSIINGMPVKYNANQTELEIYVNEPSECKWSKLDQAYESMENSFACSKRIEEMNAQMLYTCKGVLKGIKNGEDNKFYFRCKDQPIGVSEKDRNVNQESYEFVLKGTKPLNIVKAGPSNETIRGATTLVPVYLEIETDNGYNFGDSICFYGTAKGQENIQFFETGTNKHKQRQDLPSGSYTYYFKCVDLGGNTDYSSVRFRVEVDQQAPKVIRAYNYEDKLMIKTDEVSDCSYNLNPATACNFKISEGINMPYSNSTEHATEWITGRSYYIKCSDSSGNEPLPTECSVIVKTVKG